MNANPRITNRRRQFHWRLAVPALGLVLAGLFYAEENWRGKKAWEMCQSALKTRGIALNWTNYLPAAVPEDQNIFGMPEMARWFSYSHGAGWSDFTRALPSATYPDLTITSNTAAVTVAEIMTGLPGASAPDNATELRWSDPAARPEAANLINRALGPIATLSLDVDASPQAVIGNTPADYHNGSVSFADGHVEIHKWLDPRTEMRPYQARAPVPDDPDIAWLQEHCCSKK